MCLKMKMVRLICCFCVGLFISWSVDCSIGVNFNDVSIIVEIVHKITYFFFGAIMILFILK